MDDERTMSGLTTDELPRGGPLLTADCSLLAAMLRYLLFELRMQSVASSNAKKAAKEAKH